MEFHRPERRGSRPSSSDLRGGPTLAPSARCSWDRRRRLKTKCFLRRGVCPQGALAATRAKVAIIPGAPAAPGGRLILVGSARSPSRLARAGGVYRGRPPFGDRRSARGCSGAVPERRVPIRPTRQCRGKSLYKTQPACIQVRETVEGHNHAKSLIVAALVMRTSNDR